MDKLSDPRKTTPDLTNQQNELYFQDSSDESSIAMEGHYALDGTDNKFDGSRVNPDGHEGQINSDNLDRQFKNISVSDINQNISAMETDCQDTASTARDFISPLQEPTR